MKNLLPDAQKLVATLKDLMPSLYQQETMSALLGLFLEGRGYSLPHHCQTKSESAISRFLNHYKWSTLAVIRAVRAAKVDLILSQRHSKKKSILQVAVDLTTLEKVGKFKQLQDLIRVYHHKRGLHIVVMYLVLGKWRIPWGFKVYRGKGTPSPAQLAMRLLKTLPQALTQRFQVYLLGDTAFGTIELLKLVRSHKVGFHAIVGIPKTRTLKDGRRVDKICTRGQQVYLVGLDFPVYLSWVLLKRDGKQVQRFVISTKPMKGSTITRWGKRRWQIEGFFKTAKHRFGLHRFGQGTVLGVYRWLVLSLTAYLLAYWVFLASGSDNSLDWFDAAQQAICLLLPQVLLLSLFKHFEKLQPWLHQQGFELCLVRCKI